MAFTPRQFLRRLPRYVEREFWAYLKVLLKERQMQLPAP